jgi:DNA-directed RNA polymerase specialized sigma24 family protein
MTAPSSPAALPPPEELLAKQAFLRRLALSLVRDRARAEDLVQDTWTAWVEHGSPGGGGIATPRAWLARVLRNRVFNRAPRARVPRGARARRRAGYRPAVELLPAADAPAVSREADPEPVPEIAAAPAPTSIEPAPLPRAGLDFDWPQYAGGPAHDALHAAMGQVDAVTVLDQATADGAGQIPVVLDDQEAHGRPSLRAHQG